MIMSDVKYERSPRVSVCMPVYNAARFLPEAIESVLAQSYDDFEFVIVDNCSEDATGDIVRTYAGRDGRILYKRNDVNLGMVANFNICLMSARGEYIKFVMGDDLLASTETLQIMVHVLDDDDSVALVGGARKVIDEYGIEQQVLSPFGGTFVIDGPAVINTCLFSMENLIGEPTTVMFRKKHATRGFDLRYQQIVDLEMWFYLLEQGRFAYLSEPLSSFRVHDAQATAYNRNNCKYIDDMFCLLNDYGDKVYTTLNRFNKKYLYYEQCYKVWKEYRRGKIDRSLLREKLDRHYSWNLFFLLLPLYKIYKPFRRARKGMVKLFQKQRQRVFRIQVQ